MCDTIRHRGPDDAGVWLGDGVGLGHRRLSIIDLSPAGHQPMTNEDGSVWVVFNGEIYNFQTLRLDLEAKGHRFRSNSDTEVIVHLFEEYGADCVRHLHGMFAFAAWDTRAHTLLLARDRVGKKPLKYALLPDGRLLFASEIKALLASGQIGREVDLEAIDAFLTFGYVPAPKTGLVQVRKLPPAHRLVWKGGTIQIDRYWNLDFSRKVQRSIPEWQEAVRGAVRNAVERRLIADVPLGAFLSGGIDSSIVVACMAQSAPGAVETFSIGFEHESYNELPYARAVAEQYGTRHHEFIVREDEAALIPVLAGLYDEPLGDSSALPTYLLSRETRAHVTVALSGDGGDEGFAGYDRYQRFSKLRRLLGWLRTGPTISTAIAPALDLLPPKLAREADGLIGLAARDLATSYAWMVRIFTDQEKKRLRGPALRALGCPPGSRWLAHWLEDPRAGDTLLDRISFTDFMSYLPEDVLVKVDLASMAHGLEVRCPLLDSEVIELAASAPSEVRMQGGEPKSLLRSAFLRDLPPLLHNRPKMGFSPPTQPWFRKQWRSLAQEFLTGRDARIHSYLESSAVRVLLDDHVAGRSSNGYHLWSLLMLELWHREVVEARS
jgi:asparagine synthase (glutamine-hydrolysing)